MTELGIFDNDMSPKLYFDIRYNIPDMMKLTMSFAVHELDVHVPISS